MSMSPREPTLGRTLVVNVEASDTGWGLERVIAFIRVDGAPRGVVEAQRTTDPTQFRIILRVAEPGNYELVIQAVDLRGNVREEKLAFQVAAPVTETPKVETPTQAQPVTGTPVAETHRTTQLETPPTTPMTVASTPTGAATTSTWVVVIIVVLVLAAILVFLLARRRAF
jgi:hypothetical protein